MPFALTANLLARGGAVFRDADGRWRADVDAAAVYAEAAEAPLSAAKADASVLEVELIEVALADGRVRPTRLREAIRAFGPTVKSDHRPTECTDAFIRSTPWTTRGE